MSIEKDKSKLQQTSLSKLQDGIVGLLDEASQSKWQAALDGLADFRYYADGQFHKLNLWELKGSDICWRHIAYKLASIPRYNGSPISVLSHSIRVYNAVCNSDASLAQRKAALVHDAAEAYLGDCIKPVKDMLKVICPAYLELEERVEMAICESAGIDLSHIKAIKWADIQDCEWEMNALVDGSFDSNFIGDPAYDVHTFMNKLQIWGIID